MPGIINSNHQSVSTMVILRLAPSAVILKTILFRLFPRKSETFRNSIRALEVGKFALSSTDGVWKWHRLMLKIHWWCGMNWNMVSIIHLLRKLLNMVIFRGFIHSKQAVAMANNIGADSSRAACTALSAVCVVL